MHYIWSEKNYDYLTLYDENNITVARCSGKTCGNFTVKNNKYFRIAFTSDGSVTGADNNPVGSGFELTFVSCIFCLSLLKIWKSGY